MIDRAGGPMPLGLYIHIPFCSAICHYCDFAKTALFDTAGVANYFGALERHLKPWLAAAADAGLMPLTSIFFGGGTPGLFTDELAPLLALARPHLAANAEISLEANPDNVTDAALSSWRDLGFNRLSIGIQTFSPRGLRFLTRTHGEATAADALGRALRFLPNTNADLIYGWPEQTLENWLADLARCIQLGVPHLSLYHLTYEPRTPIGRRQLRGRIERQTDEEQAELYEAAATTLSQAGYEQDEVSNWARTGFTCAHNWLYWRTQPYLAIGAGAAGFIPLPDAPWGARFRYPAQTAAFSRLATPHSGSLATVLMSSGAAVEERGSTEWLLEYVACGLRTREGIDILKAEAMTGLRLRPRPVLAEGIARGLVLKTRGGRLELHPSEWLRETAWSTEVAMSFAP